MAKYFANGDKFVPLKKETSFPVLESITGTLINYETKPGKNVAGLWLVLHLKNGDDSFHVYFDYNFIEPSHLDELDSLRGKTFMIKCKYGKPLFSTIDVDSEAVIRVELLKGVIAGNIKMEDIPALLEFSKGKDDLFEMWNLFKRQIETEDLNAVKENIAQKALKKQEEINLETAKYKQLLEFHQTVLDEKESLLKEIGTTLMLLQGEDSIQGEDGEHVGIQTSENMIRISNNGYGDLIDAFKKFKTRKGVYVVCNNTIHQIHHAYLEDKGRAFLLGSSKEFLKTQPDKIKELVSKFLSESSFDDNTPV